MKTRRGETTKTAVYLAYFRYWQEHRCSPTYKQVSGIVGLSIPAIQRHVSTLIRDGYLRPMPRARYGLAVPAYEKWLTRGTVYDSAELVYSRTEAVYHAYEDYWEGRGYAPTLKEVGEVVGINHTSVYRHVVKLVEQGLLEFDPNRVKRGVRLKKGCGRNANV